MSSQIISFSYIPFEIPDAGVKFRPIIGVGISYGDKTFPLVEAMVDSGSDKCLFPAWIGERLGIEFEKSNYKFIYGIGNVRVKAYSHKVKLQIYKYTFETEIDFSFEQNTPLLGRDGFFNLFKSIKFKEKERFLDIEID